RTCRERRLQARLSRRRPPLIVNCDTRTLQRAYSCQPISQLQARPRSPSRPSLTQPTKPTLASTQAPTLQSKRIAHKATLPKGPLPQGARDTLKVYFHNLSQTPDVPARAHHARKTREFHARSGALHRAGRAAGSRRFARSRDGDIEANGRTRSFGSVIFRRRMRGRRAGSR
ncbi:hypothetical protein BD311DRAFT_841983, partial [Dichomitus squalens]